MQGKLKQLALVVAVAAGTFGGSAAWAQARTAAPANNANDLGFYAGIGVGTAKYDGACSGTTACDDNDTGFKVFGGYNFNNVFGAELGWHDLGSVSSSTAAGSGSADVKGLELSAVARFPVTSAFALFAKAGAFRWDTNTSGTFSGGSATGTDWTWGLGASYRFTRNWAARLEWQQFRDVGSGGGTDIDAVTASVVYNF